VAATSIAQPRRVTSLPANAGVTIATRYRRSGGA
jgi:hypothetical protein